MFVVAVSYIVRTSIEDVGVFFFHLLRQLVCSLFRKKVMVYALLNPIYGLEQPKDRLKLN